MSRPQPLLLRLIWLRAVIAATHGACFACFFFLGSPAYGLDPNKKVTQYIHTSWVMRDGSGQSAYGMTQTSDGFLWFTAGDMRTFDGINFVSWEGPPNGGSITKGAPFAQILQIFGDRQGGLWVFGLKEIVRLRGRDVTSRLDLPGVRSFQNVVEAEDGSVWVVRGSNSISDEPLCHVTDGSFKCFGKADGIPISPVNSLLADGKGGFWLGGQTTLIHWHDGVSKSFPIEGLKSNVGQPGVTGLAYGPDGSLWVGTFTPGPGKGLGRLINGAFQPFITPAFDGSKVAVHGLAVDRDGNLWVASYGMGLFRIHGTDVDHFGRSEGLSSDTVNAVFVDREGLLWAATTEGVDKFRDPPVATFTTVEGLGNDLSHGVLASRDGTVWVSNSGSLDRIGPDGTISSIRAANGLPGNRVTSMLEDHAGNLWVGIDDSLYLFKDGQFRRVPVPDDQPLGLVSGLAEDTDGNIWAACTGKLSKLVRIRDFRVVEILPDSQVPTSGTLASDPQGGIWIATSKGDLALFRRGVLQTFPLNANGDRVIHQIIVQGDGSVLAGSANGLVAIRSGKVDKLTTKNGLPCDFVTSFVKDRDQRWWLNTDCGVVELADSELQRWWAAPQTMVRVRVYDEADGARAGRPNFNSAAYSNGRVWFAQGNVLQMLDPARLPEKSFAAATHIRSVTVDRKEFPLVGELKVPPHPRDLQIDYTSPTFTVPQKVKFRYRLDSYDSDWHDAGTRRQAFYTDLPPGNYTFRVIAANSDGVWNEAPAALEFSIAPAYYQTNWFRALCAILLVLLAWAGYQLRIRHLHRQFEMTLDARVAERTRIARDLHDTLLQSFHGLLLRFQTALNLLPDRPAESKQVLASAIDQAAEAITDGRDAVQGLRTSTTEMNDLADSIRALGEELADENSAEAVLRVEVQGTPRALHPIVRDEVFRIAGEALRNAFRHAAAKQIEVELRYDERQLRVRVRDDGKGIDPEVLRAEGPEGHFGLRGMRERAKLAGGKLTVWSALDAGTEIELTVPAANAYVPDWGGLSPAEADDYPGALAL